MEIATFVTSEEIKASLAVTNANERGAVAASVKRTAILKARCIVTRRAVTVFILIIVGYYEGPH